MAWWRQDTASTSAIGLSISTVLFAIAFVSANLLVAEPGGVDHVSTGLDVTATTGLDVIVGQGGRTAAGGAWATTPDSIQRFGLAKDGESNFLDYVKIKAMRNGTMTNAANNAPDYPDVRAALGIGDADFHLRTYPVIPSLEDPRWSKDQRGRLAYVGHFDSAQGYATATSWANTTGSILNVSVAIRNDGADPHVFIASIGFGNLASGAVIGTDDRHTRLLAAGEVQTVWMNVPKMAYSPALTGVRIEVADSYGNVLIPAAWTAATAPTGTNVDWAPLVTAGENYYQTSETVTFKGDHVEGDGTRKNQDQTGRFVLVGPNDKVWLNQSVTLPKNKAYTFSCANCTMVGTYKATLWDAAVTRKAVDVVHVSATELFDSHAESLVAVGMKEVQILQELVAQFNDDIYSSAQPEGDIFSDSSHIRDLDDVIDRYTTIVVGSEVKQTALNSGDTKWAIANWVQAGGNLIVLGTVNSQSNWLQPVYHAAQTTANGGISAPDSTHPVLSAPNRMNYERYLDNDRAWNIKNDQPFTHVLSRGSGANSHDDTLAISAPGAYNDGTVVLTSYMAGALTNPQDDAEAKRFLHNLLSQSYTMLFLDYGPPIPPGTQVGSAQRLVAVPHPNVPNAVVEVRIVMYTWTGA